LENASKFREKLQRGIVCVGAAVTFSDPTVSEALSGLLDFVWVDAEHGPLSIESIQGHVMATKGSDAAPIVRVAWNDPVLIKPVLDIGAAGIIAPMVCTAEEARRLVAACLYPPQGIRGFGPRRPSHYGELPSQAVCKAANAAIMPIAQIEHINAVHNIDEILDVAGIAAILIGPNDLAGSMGHPGEPNHPEVQQATDAVIAAARKKKIHVGMGVTDDPKSAEHLIQKGVSWLCIPPDYMLLLQTANRFAAAIRGYKSALR
jgi:2-dehydro-3-deoxyglucarate aldolase/4-hydroxy-2-oxoheptanedioate aldolase